jgi:hypothetical protein
MTPAAEPNTDDHLVSDAWRWLQIQLAGRPVPSLVIVIGLGRGHLLQALERHAPATRVLALEPDPQAARDALAGSTCREWIASKRLMYLVDPDYAGADEAWRMFPLKPDDHLLVIAPGMTQAYGEGVVRAARIAKKIIFGARANAEARRQFAPRYLTNTLRNIPAIVEGSDIRALVDVYRGKPAVVAAAGPSLDARLPELAPVGDRALLISVDTALRPLLTAGLSPQIAVALDPGIRNARHFDALPDCPDTWLISESAMDSSVVDRFRNRTLWYRVANHHPWPWLNEIGVDIGRVDVWGSVLTAAFQVAVIAGCDPIVFVGADLSFTGDRPYARGTTYELDWGYSAAIGDNLADAWQKQMAMLEGIRVPDVNGEQVSTTTPLQAFRDWIVTRAARSRRRVINATGAGILFGNGIELGTLTDILTERHEIAPMHAVRRHAPNTQPTSALAAQCRRVRQAIVARKSGIAPVEPWHQFAGDGFDPRAVASALKAAATALDNGQSPTTRDLPSKRGSHGAASTGGGQEAVSSIGSHNVVTSLAANEIAIPWTRLRSTPEAARAIARRPEAIARLRAAINGDEPPPLAAEIAADLDSRTTLLVEALDLLRSIFDRLAQFSEDPVSPIPREYLGRPPASGFCRWPDEIAWPMQVCEGLIGMLATRWPSLTDSFFMRPVVPREDVEGSDQAVEREADPRRFLSAHARPQLVLEWLAAAIAQDSGGVLTLPRFARLVRLIEALRDQLSSRGDGTSPEAGATLIVTGNAQNRSPMLELPLGREPLLARALTGLLIAARNEDVKTTAPVLQTESSVSAPSQNPAIAVSVRLRSGPYPLLHGRTTGRVPALMMIPRVLTDEGAPRSLQMFTSRRGAVCAAHHALHSFLVREDGSIEDHSEWPRTICGVLPLGADGLVAWDVRYESTGHRGHVMYRWSAAQEPIVDEVPFGPARGLWWKDRLYLTSTTSGIASWSPGETPAIYFPDVPFMAIDHDDTHLLLYPRPDGTEWRTVRCRPRSVVRWSPALVPQHEPTGQLGGTTCRTSDQGWTATAYPTADLIVVTQAGHRTASLTCYYPFAVAWAGESLLVATGDGDLLLFERFRQAIEQQRS